MSPIGLAAVFRATSQEYRTSLALSTPAPFGILVELGNATEPARACVLPHFTSGIELICSIQTALETNQLNERRAARGALSSSYLNCSSLGLCGGLTPRNRLSNTWTAFHAATSFMAGNSLVLAKSNASLAVLQPLVHLFFCSSRLAVTAAALDSLIIASDLPRCNPALCTPFQHLPDLTTTTKEQVGPRSRLALASSFRPSSLPSASRQAFHTGPHACLFKFNSIGT